MAVAISMLRVLTGISIFWIIIPGYAIALILSFIVPPIFVGVAFDSGGVASGPMTSTFLLPLSMGACMAVGGNVVTDAFGVVALVAMTPLLAIQIMGLLYSIKSRRRPAALYMLSDDIILEDPDAPDMTDAPEASDIMAALEHEDLIMEIDPQPAADPEDEA